MKYKLVIPVRWFAVALKRTSILHSDSERRNNRTLWVCIAFSLYIIKEKARYLVLSIEQLHRNAVGYLHSEIAGGSASPPPRYNPPFMRLPRNRAKVFLAIKLGLSLLLFRQIRTPSIFTFERVNIIWGGGSGNDLKGLLTRANSASSSIQ